MVGSNLPKGLIVDLITPVTEDGCIDGTGLGRHLDRLLPYVQAVYISSPNAGSGTRLTVEQRADLFDKTLVVIRGNIPVLAWITGDSCENTLKILELFRKKQRARNYRGKVIWVDTPLYYHSNRGLPGYYEKFCSQLDENIVLHNDPALVCDVDRALKRKNIRTAILKELSENRKIGGLIFQGSLDRSYNYRRAVRARRDFRVYDGDESCFLDHPGSSGVVSAGANIAPEEWNKITVSSLSQNNEDAYPDQLQQIWDRWSCLTELSNLYSGKSAAVLSRVLADMGITAGVVGEEGGNVIEAANRIGEIIKSRAQGAGPIDKKH
jgi:dihydrodipicolinate synthase/N-acetylneuraminate lyase